MTRRDIYHEVYSEWGRSHEEIERFIARLPEGFPSPDKELSPAEARRFRFFCNGEQAKRDLLGDITIKDYPL